MTADNRLPIVACVLTAALSGCVDLTQPAQFGAYVAGRVENEAGGRVPGVQIRIGYQSMASCSASTIVLAYGVSTDSSGDYVLGLAGAGEPQTVCLKLVATPPAGLALAPDSVLVSGVELPVWSGADTVRIDLVLPPSGATAAPSRSPAATPRRR